MNLAKQMADKAQKIKDEAARKAAEDELRRQEAERQWEAKRPERVLAEFNKIVTEIDKVAEKGGNEYRYDGSPRVGVEYMEVVSMLRHEKLKVAVKEERCEDGDLEFYGDGEYRFVPNGGHYIKTTLMISW